MKLRSFLMGGLVGASTVWLVSKRQHPLMSIATSMIKGAFTKNNKSATDSKATTTPVQHLDQKSKAENESIIRSFIEQDPKLKQEFAAITKQTYTGDHQHGISAIEQLQ